MPVYNEAINISSVLKEWFTCLDKVAPRFVLFALNDGSTDETATVLESGGTPVQNGTQVRFSASLGRVDPAEAQTRNGIATTTFFAGEDSGMAEVRATSGGAGGSSTTTPAPSNGNGTTTTPTTPTGSPGATVQIAIGAGAVDTVTVSANPSSVSTTGGGQVTLTATALGTGGRLLSGIPVNFTVNRGTLSATTAATNSQGQAQVTLTTNGETTITVTAGTKTATATVTGRPGPSVVLTCSVTGGTGSGCATATVGQTVVFTASRESGSAQLTSATLDFGDNSSQSLGTLNSSTNVPHVYSQPGTYTARLTGTDTNGETSSTIQVVQVNAVAITVAASVTSGTTVSATATVNSPATNYLWNWGDSTSSSTTGATAQRTYAAPGTYTITVTATLQSGGTVTGSATVVVP